MNQTSDTDSSNSKLFCFVFYNTPESGQDLLLDLHAEITPDRKEGLYGMLGILNPVSHMSGMHTTHYTITPTPTSDIMLELK